MNAFQIEAIHKYANKFICIDGTYGTNPYDFELTSLLVADDFGEGIPVAYMVCNKKDTRAYEIFFSEIRNCAGNILTNAFMSDITETFYNAWRSVMGAASNRLLCSWHVDRAWRSNLMKISSSSSETTAHKRKEMYEHLKQLQTCLSIENFYKYYHQFIIYLQNDLDTKQFYNYFIINYGNNHSLWAYCYRQGLGVNTNMYLESMHRIIKYEYLEGKKVKRLDKALHSLMRFTRDKQVKWLIKITNGKNTTKINSIHESHRTALHSNLRIEEIEAGERTKWIVYLYNNDNNNSYTIQERTHNSCCSLRCQNCNICYYSYNCTCTSYFIKNNICKHIHFVCIQKQASSFSEPVDEIGFVHDDKEELISTAVKGLCKVSKDYLKLQKELVSAALKLVTLAEKLTDTTVLSTAIKQVTATNALLEITPELTTQKFDISNAAKDESANRKIDKQGSFYSTKQSVASNKKVYQKT